MAGFVLGSCQTSGRYSRVHSRARNRVKLELKCLRGAGQVRQGPVGRWKRSLEMKNKRRGSFDRLLYTFIESAADRGIQCSSYFHSSFFRTLFPSPPYSGRRLLFSDCRISSKVRGPIALHRSRRNFDCIAEHFIRAVTYRGFYNSF